MRLFTFAISSIVDVNTGHGLAGSKQFLQIDAASGSGRKPRLISAHGLLTALRGAISSWIERYRVRAQERRELAELLGMSDRLLRDIGLSRGDLIAVELGSLSLQQLQSERRGRRDGEHEIVSEVKLGRATEIEHEAANEASYQERKCA